jgi:hypothetical protein
LLRNNRILLIIENQLSNFMKNLTINFQRSYRKAGKTAGAPARVTFVYTVTGTADAVANYRELNAAFLREDDNGTPLFFTTRYAGERAALALNHSGTNYYVDNSEMDKQAALVAQYGGNLGQAIAMQIAAQAAGIGQRTPQAQPQPSSQELGSI